MAQNSMVKPHLPNILVSMQVCQPWKRIKSLLPTSSHLTSKLDLGARHVPQKPKNSTRVWTWRQGRIVCHLNALTSSNRPTFPSVVAVLLKTQQVKDARYHFTTIWANPTPTTVLPTKCAMANLELGPLPLITPPRLFRTSSSSRSGFNPNSERWLIVKWRRKRLILFHSE
jgi:hypothetical protein